MQRTPRLAVLGLTALAVACAPAAASAKTVGNGASGSKVSLSDGESLVIKLKPGDSGSSGYHWRVAKKPAKSVLKLKSNKTSSDGKRQVFTYVARGGGSTSLKLQYVPPAQGAKPTKTFKLGVTVSVQGAASAARCAKAGSKTLAQNGSVRVYQTGKGVNTSLFACRRSTGKKTKLATAFDDGFTSSASYGDVRLAGLFVALSYTATDNSCKADCPPGYEPTTNSIGVFDAAKRTTRVIDGYPVGDALVLSRNGGVAWAAQNASTGPVEIHASVRKGDDRVLDSGAIDPKTLAIEITIISWTKDGEESFARLK
jgi:predicted secreted protein